jgi:2-keto-4-pentenoate hydratase/2-oxohepta-3-ene-1,7-dioic acid hydratase in catechol pathway
MTIPDIPTVFLYVPRPSAPIPSSPSQTNNPQSKPPTCLADPYPAPTIIPKHTLASDSADYESELAIVIGKEAKNVSEADALDYVLGYTASNDISSRSSQFAQTQWCYSKGFDGACPIGPVLVNKRLVPEVGKLRLRGLKNGKVVQDSGLT